MDYLTIKWLHIISATVLFGTGLGSAYYKFLADRSKNTFAIAITNKNLVLADWLFTTPTIIIQPVTGFILMSKSGYNLTEPWLLLSLFFFIIAGACWLPVVVLQIKMRNLSDIASKTNTDLSVPYWYYAKIWFKLGIPAFILMLVIFYFMTNKPDLF